MYKNVIYKYAEFRSERIFTFVNIKRTKLPCVYKIEKEVPATFRILVSASNLKFNNLNSKAVDIKNVLCYCKPVLLELVR